MSWYVYPAGIITDEDYAHNPVLFVNILSQA